MRRTRDVVIAHPAAPAPGEKPKEDRDAGKVFLLTEMSAMRAEDWATRMWLALAKNNADIPSSAIGTGWAGLFAFGIHLGITGLTRMDYGDLKPLWGEMMACVQIKPDPRNPQVVRPLVEDDIEEVATILKLRDAVIELHTGFSIADALSRAASAEPQAPAS